MVDKIFGASGGKVVVEEFISGPEVSVLAFCDGKTIKTMPSSMDHKRIGTGDVGPNTGGMGTISPNPFYTPEIEKECFEKIFIPTVENMRSEGAPFKGCLYFGLMLTAQGVRVIEYNARFGDPETQVILPRLKTDFVDIINAVIDEKLDEIEIEWNDDAAVCVIMAAEGYPGSYQKGTEITGLLADGNAETAVVFHAGTKFEDGKFKTNGGRVLGVLGKGENIQKACEAAYAAAGTITFAGAQFRTDIGLKGAPPFVV
jgi:phosphoribosylamine--glycine ligase